MKSKVEIAAAVVVSEARKSLITFMAKHNDIITEFEKLQGELRKAITEEQKIKNQLFARKIINKTPAKLFNDGNS